jgi:hypothetical protein
LEYEYEHSRSKNKGPEDGTQNTKWRFSGKRVSNGFKQNPVIMENISLNKTVCKLTVRMSNVDFIESLGLTVRMILLLLGIQQPAVVYRAPVAFVSMVT